MSYKAKIFTREEFREVIAAAIYDYEHAPREMPLHDQGCVRPTLLRVRRGNRGGGMKRTLGGSQPMIGEPVSFSLFIPGIPASKGSYRPITGRSRTTGNQ